jgi:2-amino-4-hydroxy-6-hydroxymethyldihydropteridine diphosphokinase
LFPSNKKAPAATHTIYLALGSNLGDRRGNLSAALQQLREIMDITAVSSVYETEPVGYLDQPRFLNIVCIGKTELLPEELLKQVKEVETRIGRQPTFRNGPRSIDIDIIFFDDLQLTQDNLTIPHPRMSERAFVLVPLAEIAPDAVDPTSGRSVQEMLAAIQQDGVRKIAANLRISLDNDIQNGHPTVHTRLGRVGITGAHKALLLGNEEHQQWFDVTFDLYADLNASQAGVHMSRFTEALEESLKKAQQTNGLKLKYWQSI